MITMTISNEKRQGVPDGYGRENSGEHSENFARKLYVKLRIYLKLFATIQMKMETYRRIQK